MWVLFFSLFFQDAVFMIQNAHADAPGQYLFVFFHRGLILVPPKLDGIALSCMFTRLWTSITSIGRSGHMVR